MYYLSINNISRGKGKSAVAAAAYCAGEKLYNNFNGKTYNFTKKEGIIHTEILLPANAPAEYKDRSTLWNSVENAEKRKNARLIRDIMIALPNELPMSECIALAHNYVQKTFVDKGMCADICIHSPQHEQKNIHAHILLTTRPIKEDGTWGAKTHSEYILDKNGNKIYDEHRRRYKRHTVYITDWNARDKVEEWRKAWADHLNAVIIDKVDHRSYKRQGKLIKPTIHMGSTATEMERKGIRTRKGDINREIKYVNKRITSLMKRLDELDDFIMKMESIYDKNNFAMTLIRLHENGIMFTGKSGHTLSTLNKASKLSNLPKLIEFVQEHKIANLSELKVKNAATIETLSIHKEIVKKKQNRIKVLKELLNNYAYYRNNKPVYIKWKSITNQKKKDSFYNKHHGEISLYQTANRLFNTSLDDKRITPIDWKNELTELEEATQNEHIKIDSLDNDISIMETIIYNIEKLVKNELKSQKVYLGRISENEPKMGKANLDHECNFQI
nr:MobQ family relaxase [Ruminococcus sp.]